MQILLDTHVFLWFITDHPSLTARMRKALLDEHNTISLSAASYWEISIKQALGKLQLTDEWPWRFEQDMVRNAIQWLPIEKHHCQALAQLPAQHGDPFDRMLVAQAISERLVLATNDRAILRYPVETL